MDFVRDVVDLIYFRYCDNFFVLFRKLFEIFFFVVIWGEELFCYFFGENSWCMLCKILFEYGELQYLFFCKGDLYSIVRLKLVIVSYNLYINSWMWLLNIGEDIYLLKIYVGNDELYVLLFDVCIFCIDSYIRFLENDLYVIEFIVFLFLSIN